MLAAFERRLEDAADALEADLLVYTRAVAEEGREGIVAAVHDWLVSGELVRVGAAVHVVARLGLTELEPRARPSLGAAAPRPAARPRRLPLEPRAPGTLADPL